MGFVRDWVDVVEVEVVGEVVGEVAAEAAVVVVDGESGFAKDRADWMILAVQH